MEDQNHPLYSTDRSHIDRLLGKESPDHSDLVDLARLIIRYQDFPGARDLKRDMEKALGSWNLSREKLDERVRQIWENNYRPGMSQDEEVGSGFDTAAPDDN